MTRYWRYCLPAYVLLAPLTLIGLLHAVIVYRAAHWRWHDGIPTCIAGAFERSVTPKGPHETVTRIWGRPGAQTIGMLVVFASEHARQRADLRVHEAVHVVQAMWFALGGLVSMPIFLAGNGLGVWGALISAFGGGLLWALAYGACFLVPYARGGFSDWYAAYRASPFERQAYAIQDEYLESRPVDQAHYWGHR